MNDRTAIGAQRQDEIGDSAGYVRRNLATAYRLASVVLDDPVLAQTVVHDAAIRAWYDWGGRPAKVLDAAFRRELESGCRAILTAGGDDAGGGDLAGLAHRADPLVAAMGALGTGDRYALAREYAPVETSPPDGSNLGGFLRRRAKQRRTSVLLARLLRSHVGVRAGSTADDSDVPTRLRGIYASRDPGPDVPLDLRLRLNRSLAEAESAAERRASRDRAAGWRFAVNAFMLVVAGTVALAFVSVTDLRAAAQATAGPISGPTTPLTITSVSVVQGEVGGTGAHVAASGMTLVLAYQGPAVWHASARQCLPDVAGTIDLSGNARWPGSPAGHVQSMAADPAAGNVYAAGLGEYCDPGARVSTNGGATWTDGSLPPGSAGSVAWLGYDPAHADTLVAAVGGVLSVSRDAGRTWSASTETVVPIAFGPEGRLYGWGPGALFESLDDGGSWDRIGTGPAAPPSAGAAVPGGLLIGGTGGAWLYPIDVMSGMDGAVSTSGPPTLVQPGTVYSIATAGDGAVILGGDSSGHPWLGTWSARQADAPFSPISLPVELSGLTVAGGQVAANSAGAAVALIGGVPVAATSRSVILFATFAH